MKFLLVGAGRRNQLVKLIKQKNIAVHSYELDKNCPIKLIADEIIQGKSWNDKSIFFDLMQLSKNYDLVIPLMDKAVEIVSELNINNSSTSSFETSSLCLRKDLFEKYFCNDEELKYIYPVPDSKSVVLKPILGQGSKGIYYKNSNPGNVDGYIVQKKITGKEYSVDCFYDVNSNLVDFVPRERIRVSSGEVMESITVNKSKFESIINLISKKINFKGPICMQFIEDNNGKIWIMEINARLGGGSTLSISSGLDLIQLLIESFCLKTFDITRYQSTWKENYKFIRYTLDYCYEA
ncbi:MAG: ATP-grasp domain-containing protein [Flavobacteriaceae bacterium]|nr:ATP-grasp domain-containing protein [Flavobacteriaceae bacterium]